MAEAFTLSGRRSVVYGTRGCVASSQPLATQIGLDILKRGGNAADAAVATAAALNVTEPASTGIGGDVFCLYYDASTRKVRCLNGSGRSPAALSLELLRSRGHDGAELPSRDINCATVPGAAAAWADVVKTFGSGSLSLSQVLEPACQLAEDGFPVAPISAHLWQHNAGLLLEKGNGSSEMLIEGTTAPAAGDIIHLPNLAKTFRVLGSEGKKGFYGPNSAIAQAIVDAVVSRGGVMALGDLEAHKSTIEEPISIEFGDVRVWEAPPNGQGIVALMALGMLRDKLDELRSLGHNSADYLHHVIEALRHAFADGRRYICDPANGHVPVDAMLSQDYLRKRAGAIDASCAVPVTFGSPTVASDTVYLCVVDAAGNACSFINSNYSSFGTGVVPTGCGFTLQNRGANFVLMEGHPNCIRGSARPYHTIIPGMVTRVDDGALVCPFGVMGGFMQPQGHTQVLLNMLVFGMDPQAALDAPRFCIEPLSHARLFPRGLDVSKDDCPPAAVDGVDGSIFSLVALEHGIPGGVSEELARMGHTVRGVEGWKRSLFGRGQIIRRSVTNGGRIVLAAGSDPRGDGCAAAY